MLNNEFLEDVLHHLDRHQSNLTSVEWMKNLLHTLNLKFEEVSSILSPDEDIYRQFYFVLQFKYANLFKSAFCDFMLQILEEWCQNEDTEIRAENTKLKLKPVYLLRLNDVYGNVIVQALIMYIESHASKMLHNSYDTMYSRELKTWLEVTIFPLVYVLYSFDETESNEYVRNIENTNRTLLNYLYSAIARVRTNELFEIIAEYPDSIEAIRELRDMSHLSFSTSTSAFLNSFDQTFVGKQFRKTLCRRLLHPGASTSQILDMYVSMIRALRVLDSSDLLLNYVAAPVRVYLKNRRDTVQCIVSSLSLGKESDLHSELKRGGSLEYGQDEDYEDPMCAENWEPRKRNPELSETGHSGLDVLALLVSIYGSTDVFVSEYRNQLAEKLLVQSTQHLIDNEVMTLEHLKKR